MKNVVVVIFVALFGIIGVGYNNITKNEASGSKPEVMIKSVKNAKEKQSVTFQYNLNMVHHNPGEPPFVTKYNDPYYLKEQGFNGQVPRIFLPCAITYDSFDPELMPKGSKARTEAETYALKIDKEIRQAKEAGMPLYPFTDLLVVPKSIQEKYGKEMSLEGTGTDKNVLGGTKLKASILQPRTEEVLRAQIFEIFKRFPDLAGLTTRFGETYIHEFPDYAGGSPAGNPAEQIALINILRDEICVKRNKKLFYRTWDFGHFHTNPAYYLEVTNAVEPHPNLVFSIKHVQSDYIRLKPFNPCLGIGKHQQIVEISCNPAGLYGKNAHPYYIGKGVIDGWEEFAWIKNTGPAKCLHDLLKCPQVIGIWTWARGDGWAGPYINNELWVDLNIQVFTRFAREPWRSEEELFNDAARYLFGIDGDDLIKLRKLCLLSASAVMHGQASVYANVSDWWCRDEYLTAIDLSMVIKNGKIKEVLEEKAEAVKMWRTIEKIARTIHLPNKADQEFLEVSCTYGRIKYQIFEQIWKIQLLAEESEINKKLLDADLMQAYILTYDKLWKEWKKLKSDHLCCPTLYRDDKAQYCPFPPFREVLDQYRVKIEKLKAEAN
ncbi:MAG: hypothetical protein PHR83_11180 [Paludibacter sp.]|nr:hypothetical protein [Paludibacter sp.]